ncbi:hypothetical protein PRIPAC_91650 [Pristionchus pacificus]|uniref:Uncharacterized protein n=1 Tax=Pristionchus pacificus TaxID=54126 RepID=A0A2A6BBC8_PRIPA|nr:hypothetical protein PRIPAC_91650 [Pristionchus pacificus]|eukprot:PDM63189.1 hypothetical protein PRIPAC_50404 [Pristionchus pacificus]
MQTLMIICALFSISWALECYERTYVIPGTIDIKLNKECSSAQHCVAFEGNSWDVGFFLRRGYCDEEMACEEIMRESNSLHKVCKPSSISFQLAHDKNVNVNGNLCCSGNLCNTAGLAGPEVPFKKPSLTNCPSVKNCTSFEGVVDGFAVNIARCDGWIAGVSCRNRTVPVALPNGQDVDVKGKACCCKGDRCNTGGHG